MMKRINAFTGYEYEVIPDQDGITEINLRDFFKKDWWSLPWLEETYNCIYLITNLINGKVYVGQTVYLYNRFTSEGIYGYLGQLAISDHAIHQAIRKYKSRNFKVEILAKNEEDLNPLERHFVKEFHSCLYDENCWGYNMTWGGDDCSHLHTKEVYDKIKENHGGVLAFNTPEAKEYANQRRLEIWGDPMGNANNPEARKLAHKHRMKTCIELYGDPCGNLHTPESEEKALKNRLKTIADLYDGDCAGQLHTSESLEKALETNRSNHGGILSINTIDACENRAVTLVFKNIKNRYQEGMTTDQYIEAFEGSDFYRHLKNVFWWIEYMIIDPRWTPEYTRIYSEVYDRCLNKWEDWTIKHLGPKNPFNSL